MLCTNDSTCSVVLCFQAEDGIRDLVRSRGLGDVYKRQDKATRDSWDKIPGKTHKMVRKEVLDKLGWFGAEAVSYTHLTLPTSDLVEISVVAVSLKKKQQTESANAQKDI